MARRPGGLRGLDPSHRPKARQHCGFLRFDPSRQASQLVPVVPGGCRAEMRTRGVRTESWYERII